MGTLNTIKFKILEKFVFSLGFSIKSQLGSHIKYDLHGGVLIIPKHKEISRGTVNNIFKIISVILDLEKNEYKNIIPSVLEAYSLEDLEDLLLGYHMRECENEDFVSEKEIFNILRK